MLSEERGIIITFAEHLPADRVAGMVGGIAAYGNVDSTDNPHQFTVRVFRAGKLPRLKKQLQSWETYGFLRWQEHV